MYYSKRESCVYLGVGSNAKRLLMNQHYIPRVYLKNFATLKRGEYYINVVEKTTGRKFETNIKNICAETDLYTLKEDSKIAKHNLAIEKAYSDFIEPSYEKAYSILNDDRITKITPIQRADVIVGLLSLYFRNPIHLDNTIGYHENQIKNIIIKAKKQNFKKINYIGIEYDLETTNELEIINLLKKEIRNEFKEKHFSYSIQLAIRNEFMIIEVEKLTDESEFITCDNPINLENQVIDTWNVFNKYVTFSIPINRKYCVKLFFDKNKSADQIYRTNEAEGWAYELNKKLIENSKKFYMSGSRTEKFMLGYDNFFKENDDIEFKMKVIKDILSNDELIQESKKGAKLLREYYELYLNNEIITMEQEQQFMQNLNLLNIEIYKNKIK